MNSIFFSIFTTNSLWLFLILITVLWPLWIAFGQWILYYDDSDDEIRVRIDLGYIIEPAFIVVSLYIGIIFQCIVPRTKSAILPTLKSMSSYYLLFYFVLLFFCLPGSTTVNVCSTEKLWTNTIYENIPLKMLFYGNFNFSFSMPVSFYQRLVIVQDGFWHWHLSYHIVIALLLDVKQPFKIQVKT